MKANPDTEILSVGTELLLGNVTNTDARDISEMLSAIGINVKYHTVVGDNPSRLTECVNIAKDRADIIITTGGLGPTCDDLTKQTLASAFSLELKVNEEELAVIDKKYRDSGHPTENVRQEAMLPENCTVFHNPCGTAPGCAFEAEGKLIIMLPGPPKECRAMFSECAVPFLKKYTGSVIVSHTVNIFGMSENEIDAALRKDMDSMTNPTMAPYAKECDCLVRLTAKAATEAEAEEMLKPAVRRVRDMAGDFVYGMDVETMEQALMELLKAHPITFSAAESCTGGELAKRFTDLPGASEFFMGGAVTYTNNAKSVILGIPPELIEKYGAVSRPVAEEMAKRVRALLNTDVGIGITGLAGPDGDGVNPVGTVFVSLADRDSVYVRKLYIKSAIRTRTYIRHMAENNAFDMLRRYITALPVA